MTTLLRPVAALALAAVLVPACRRQAPAENADEQSMATPVAARPAKSGSLRAVVRVSGVIIPADGAEFLLVAPEPARILEITKAVGDAVSSGEVLVRFELAGAAQDLARRRSELAGAQAQLESARLSQTRTRDFVARGLIPRIDLDAADRELSDAQSAVDRAAVLNKAAETAASRAVVSAPFAGIVAARLHNPGDLAQAAATDPILRIVDPKRVEIVASVAPAEAARVLPGASGRLIDSRDGTVVRLSVAARSAVSAATGRMVPVRLLPIEQLTVPVDTSVAIEIDAEERTGVVFVTPDVLVREGNETAVMVAVGNRAERRAVTTGISTDTDIEITSGLEPGELVITQGQIGLPDGAAINVVIAGSR
jgi:RND family efflux transporter MFP subunit